MISSTLSFEEADGTKLTLGTSKRAFLTDNHQKCCFAEKPAHAKVDEMKSNSNHPPLIIQKELSNRDLDIRILQNTPPILTTMVRQKQT